MEAEVSQTAERGNNVREYIKVERLRTISLRIKFHLFSCNGQEALEIVLILE